MEPIYILITGAIDLGLLFFGPFNSTSEAYNYANENNYKIWDILKLAK